MARKLEVEIVGDASGLNRALKTSQTGWKKWASAGAAAGVAASITTKAVDLLGEGIKSSINAALEAQKSQARLAVAFKNAGKAIGPYEKQIAKAESASRKLGFTDDDTRQSLGSLITVTHNYKEALKEMAIAQNLARFKGVSLEQATKALTMAHAGSLRAIKQLGLDVPKVTDAQDKLKAATKDHTTEAYKNALAQAKQADKAATLKNVLETVTNATKGQAKAYADTAAGAMSQFHAQLQHIEEEVGLKLLPIMTKAIIFIRDHWPEISKAITQAWAQIKPTLVALEQLVISVVQVIRSHWSTIGPIVMDVVRIIKTELAILSTTIKLFTDLLKGNWGAAWDDVKKIVSLAFQQIENIFRYEKDILVAVAKGLGTAIWQGLKAGIEAGLGAIKDAVTGLFDKVIGWAKSALGIASPSKVFHGIGQNVVKGFINGVGSMAGDLKSAVIRIAEHAGMAIVHKAQSAARGVLGGGGGTARGGTATQAALAKQGDALIGTKGPVVQQVADAVGWAMTHGWHGSIASGYRTYQEQAALYQNYLNGGPLAAKPGTSSHETGQAVDVTDPSGFAAALRGAPSWAKIFNRLGAADPVHFSVSGYDTGGVVPGLGPQLAVVHGGETILPTHKAPMVVNLVLDGKVLASQLIDPLRGQSQIYKQRTGRQAFA